MPGATKASSTTPVAAEESPNLGTLLAARGDAARRELDVDEVLAGALGTRPPESTDPGREDALPDTEFYPKAPLPGGRVGRYLVEEVLGRGGMGLVLRAHDELLQRDVAIKVILPHYLNSDPTAGLRFLREAEIVAKLRHPNIIVVHDAGLDRGVAYLAFDYVRGDNYSELRRQGPLTLETALDRMLPILGAVAHANRLGIVHGDLKPTNLLLASDHRGAPHPYVLDFGVSFFSGLDAGLDPTRGKITGTPGYIAPEWWESEPIDGRADCFSLGCVLYELVCGRGPFSDCQRLSEALTLAKRRQYPRIADRVGSELAEVIDRALAPDRRERFESVSAFGRALLPFASERSRYSLESEFAD